MKILVTGATGFIGYHLVKELTARLNAKNIVCLVRSVTKAKNLEALGVSVLEGDLMEENSLHDICRDMEIVFHLAACVRFGVRDKSRVDFDSPNVKGTKNLLEACPKSVRRFIYMSSVNAVERPFGDPCISPLTEESPCHPHTLYGRSKLKAEKIVRKVAGSKKISFLILRPPSLVYGNGCNPESGMAKLILGVARHSFFTSIRFPGRFSLIHVKDLASATADMGLSDQCPNQTFFLADEPPVTLGEITKEIAFNLGIRCRQIRLPRSVFHIADLFTRLLLQLPLIGSKIPFQLLMLLHDEAAVSSTKIRLKARFQTHVPLKEGLKDTIPWVLNSKTSSQ